MSPASPDERDLGQIKSEADELERRVQHLITQEGSALSELREIKERLSKLEEQIAVLRRSLLLRDLGV